MKKTILILMGILIVGGLGVYIFLGQTDEAKVNNETNQEVTESAQPVVDASKKGEYIDYSPELLSKNADKDQVLFFHASWCPTCRELDKNINSESIPENLIIYKTDYDAYTDLKEKYGVTYQHTLVQVDDKGNNIKKWSHSYTVQEIVDELQ